MKQYTTLIDVEKKSTPLLEYLKMKRSSRGGSRLGLGVSFLINTFFIRPDEGPWYWSKCCLSALAYYS